MPRVKKSLIRASFLRKADGQHVKNMKETDVKKYRYIHISEEKKKERKKYRNKIKIGFFLDKGLVEKFRVLIQEKYAKYEKGLLSLEAEMALRHWIGLHTRAQSQLLSGNKPYPAPKVILVFNQVKEYLLRTHYLELNPGQTILRAHLEEAIMNIRGSDQRTIRKWLKAFHKMGLIKPEGPVSWTICK